MECKKDMQRHDFLALHARKKSESRQNAEKNMELGKNASYYYFLFLLQYFSAIDLETVVRTHKLVTAFHSYFICFGKIKIIK